MDALLKCSSIIAVKSRGGTGSSRFAYVGIVVAPSSMTVSRRVISDCLVFMLLA